MSTTDRTPFIGGSEKIKLRGDRLLIDNFEIINKDLVDFLSKFDNVETALTNLVEVALQIQSISNSTIASQTIENKVINLLDRLESTKDALIEELNSKANMLVDPNNGSVTKAIKDQADSTFKVLLNSDNQANQINPSPLFRLKQELLQEISDLKDSLGLVQNKLRIGSFSEKTASDGTNFEDDVALLVQKLGKPFGDFVELTGAKAEIGTSKKGDLVANINREDTNNQQVRVVWEIKTDGTFKGSPNTKSRRISLDKVRAELEKAMENRSATCGVFVIDSTDLDMNVQAAWVELDGDKLILVVDPMDIQTDFLQLAYLWSRWRAKISLTRNQTSIDSEGVQRTVEMIRVDLKILSQIKRNHNSAVKEINKSSTQVDELQKVLKKRIAELAQMIDFELDASEDDVEVD